MEFFAGITGRNTVDEFMARKDGYHRCCKDVRGVFGYPHPQYANRNYGPRYRQCKKFVEREKSIASPYKHSADFIKKEFSSESMNEQIGLLMKMRTEHPTGAIGKSKEVLESCCKTILANQGIDIPDEWDAPRLSKETA